MSQGIIPKKKQDENIGIVTHGDVIKLIICLVLDLNLDLLYIFKIDPGSISELEYGPFKRLNLLNFIPRENLYV